MSIETSWRIELSKRLQKKGERTRIAEALGVKPRTLTRWITQTSNPQWEEIKVIARVFPELAPLIFQEFLDDTHGERLKPHTGSHHHMLSDAESMLPGSLYAEILHIVTSQPDYYHIMSKNLLNFCMHALNQEQAGIKIAIAICRPPDPQTLLVRSLLVRVELATSPFEPTTLREPNLFLGAESLAGSVVTKQHWEIVQMGATPETLPLELFPMGTRVIAIPMQRWGLGIAGCVLFGSMTKPLNISQLQHITNLFGLMFPDTHFFSPESIDLDLLPNWTIQRTSFAHFRDRAEKIQQKMGIDLIAAEQVLRKHIETELIMRNQDTIG